MAFKSALHNPRLAASEEGVFSVRVGDWWWWGGSVDEERKKMKSDSLARFVFFCTGHKFPLSSLSSLLLQPQRIACHRVPRISFAHNGPHCYLISGTY